jgi:hypothetical protein
VTVHLVRKWLTTASRIEDTCSILSHFAFVAAIPAPISLFRSLAHIYNIHGETIIHTAIDQRTERFVTCFSSYKLHNLPTERVRR